MRQRFKQVACMIAVLVLLLSALPMPTVTAAAASFTAWTETKNSFPDFENTKAPNYKYYFTKTNPYVATGYGLPNCTAYAYGRAYETLRREPKLPNSNACDWYEYNRENQYYPYGNQPMAGAIACWSGGSSGSGHVAFVESVKDNVITLSESAWSWGRTDKEGYRILNAGRSYMRVIHMDDYQVNSWYGTSYEFQGYIYLFQSPSTSSTDKTSDETWKMAHAVNIRDGASMSANIIDCYSTGTTINVREYQAKDGYLWGRVGKNAWCAIDYCNYVSGTNRSGTYGITYDLNGGSYQGDDYMQGQIKKKGTNIKLVKAKPTRKGYQFAGWATSPTSPRVSYQAGATYKANQSVTLYAVWKGPFVVSEKDISLDYYSNSAYCLAYRVDTAEACKLVYSRSDPSVVNCSFDTANRRIFITAQQAGTCDITIRLVSKKTGKTLDRRGIRVTVKRNSKSLVTDSVFKKVSLSNVSESTAKISTTLNKSYAVTEYGVSYGTSTGAMKKQSVKKKEKRSEISLSWNKGLRPATRYYVQFYFVSGGKTYTSQMQYFTTLGKATVTAVSIYKYPKQTYTIGESLSDSGMVLKVKYSNGRCVFGRSQWTISGFQTKSAGKKTVTVSFGGKNTTYPITVNCPTPAKPSITSVTNTTDGVKVAWKKAARSNAYVVYRRKVGTSSWTKLKETTARSYTDASAKNGTRYEYAVKGKYQSNGHSKTGALSKTVSALCLTSPNVSMYSRQYNRITIKWSANSKASGYYIYRRVKGKADYTRIATVKSKSTTTYTDTKTTCGTTYEYAVRAYASGERSGYRTVSIRCAPAKVKISSLTAKKGSVTVKYGKVSGATGYEVQYKLSGKSYQQLAVTGKTSITKSLVKGKTYTYKVRAYRIVKGKKIYGSYSAEKTVKT